MEVLGLLFQQTAGLLIDPVLQQLVHFLGAQIALEGGSIILVF